MEQNFDECKLFILRHGERADKDQLEKKKIELKYDPHLTPLGTHQAFEAGYTIKKTLNIREDSQNQPKYLVLCSPYLRCIMTACSLIKNLGSENVFKETIFLDNTIAEHMDPYTYEKNPLPHLHVRKEEKSYLKKYFEYKLQDGLISEGEHVSEPDFPENDLYPRPNRVMNYQKFLDKVADLRNEHGDLVVVIVTHWYGVEYILEAHGHDRHSLSVGYASVSHVLRKFEKNPKDTIVYLNDSSHLQAALEKYKKAGKSLL